jgi:transcriptional regulator with XRE-family HTH domain
MRKSDRNIIKRKLGRKVRDFRLSSNMSQAALADKADTRRAQISEIERGKANPTLDTLLKIATALAVQLNELFESRR